MFPSKPLPKIELTKNTQVFLVNGSQIVATVTPNATWDTEFLAATLSGERYRCYQRDCFMDQGRLCCSGFQSLGR